MINRRLFLRSLVAAALFPVNGRAASGADFQEYRFNHRRVFRIDAVAGPSIVLLHELPGMTPDDMALARRLASKGFTVHLPLLFGEPGQDSFISGYFQSCAYGEFECARLSARSPILDWLDPFCRHVIATSRGPVGVIGMCLTGALPIALLNTGIEAAVLCQPTLPFNLLMRRPFGEQKSDLGVAPGDLDNALKKSKVPLLAMRYASDALCPHERMQTLRTTFNQRIATIEIQGGDGHSTLAGDFDRKAFADTIKYLTARLRFPRVAQDMALARLEGKKCRITDQGEWRAAE